PDVFLDGLGGLKRRVISLAIRSMRTTVTNTLLGASALTAPSTGFLMWGLERARRKASPRDKIVPFGYPESLVVRTGMASPSDRFLVDSGVPVDPRIPVVCFVGTVGYQFDFESVVTAAKEVAKTRLVYWVMAGGGERLSELQETTREQPNILWLGRVDASTVRSLMKRSVAAMAPY